MDGDDLLRGAVEAIDAELINHILTCEETFCLEFKKALVILDYIDAHGCEEDSRIAGGLLLLWQKTRGVE
jgi:hypothetical protein